MTSGLKALICLTRFSTIFICLNACLNRGLSNMRRSTESLNRCKHGSASSLGRKHSTLVPPPWAIPLASRMQYSPKSKPTNATFTFFPPLFPNSACFFTFHRLPADTSVRATSTAGSKTKQPMGAGLFLGHTPRNYKALTVTHELQDPSESWKGSQKKFGGSGKGVRTPTEQV
jgi:hypothetical protein